MNKFDLKLHSALFNKEKSEDGTNQAPETVQQILNNARQEEKELKDEIENTNTRRNNESLGSAVEKVEQDEVTDKELSKQLKQLAKNKKIDFAWTENEWKCSKAEKKLAISSAKVFQQLLDQRKLQEMINLCKSQNGELTKDVATEWNIKLGINSKVKDIQNFYKAYQEYQKPQSSFQHLKNLMGYFCENGFENMNNLKESMSERSQKISRKQIEEKGNDLYPLKEKKGKNGSTYYERLDKDGNPRPKDWKQRVTFEVIKDRLDGGQMNKADKLLTLLGDFNLDGEVNSGDVGYKTGTELADVFRRIVATHQLKDSKFDNNKAVSNLVDYANKFGLGIENATTVEGLYKWMTNSENGYENTKTLQDFVKNLSIEIDDVLVNGEKAGAASLDHIVNAIEKERAEEAKANEKTKEKTSTEKGESIESDPEAIKKAAEDKTKEILTANEQKFKELIKNAAERTNLMQQLAAQLPGILVDRANDVQRGVGVGARVPLDQIIKGASAGFHTGLDSKGKPKFGLFVGWDKKFNLSKRTDVSAAINGGANLLFIPCGSASLEIGQDINKGSREKSLEAKGEHKITLGGNVSITGGIFSRGASAGYENNKQRGIEKQAENINKVLKEQAKPRVEALRNLKPEDGGKEVTFEQKKEALKKALMDKKTGFPGTSPKMLETPTNNLLSIIQQFKIDEKNTEKDFDTYAQIIADVYSEQWRNAAIAGIADNKRKISGGKLGIQFFAGFIPVGTAVMKFTKYYNARTNETEHSSVARIDAQVNGVGNGKNILEDLKAKEIGSEQVSQINEILKRYGAKLSLEYIDGKDGKPGKIQVPASMADGMGINIRVSESLKGCVGQMIERRIGGETFYQFPANAVYRLLQETGGNQRSLTLNIGSDKSSTSDVMISDAEGMKNFLGNNELMGDKKWQDKEAVKSGFEKPSDKLSLLSGVEVVLRDMDTDNRKAFSEFTRDKTQARADFDGVVKAFTDALKNSPKIDAAVKQDFMEKFKALGNEDKQLIIDRVISIAAYYEDVHNEAGLQKRIDARVKRGDKYKTLTGPNGKEIFSKFGKDYRSEVVNDLKGSSYASESMPNILGATAFYNKRLDNDARGLGTTGLGVTTVLGGKTVKLDENDAPKAKEWFLGEHGILKKEPYEWNNLKNLVKEKLPDWAKDKLGDDNLKKILSGEEIEIRLDNSEKKVKVNMNVDYRFYLMGECGNESVGMQLGDLTVVENEEVGDYRQGALYLNNFDGSNSVNVSRKDIAAGFTFGGGKKQKKEQEENSVVKTEGETHSTELPTTQTQTDDNDNQKVDIDNTADSGNNNYSYEEL